MSDEAANWGMLQSLFELAAQTPAADRERILCETCPDPELRRRVLVMVEGINLPDVPIAPPVAPAGSPRRIGPYSLLRLIGAGGIGSVYLVERIFGGAPQRVALKVLAPHAAGPSFIERFHREQHILASLDHPNITRLLDAGISEDDQPYLLMEFIEGEHLDEYCNARQLSVRERIGLFLQVCDAVAYAHRNLIVHLDLKPSNILVNTQGVAKLLDFGTSKLIQPDSHQTTTVLATPAYASPEQLRNEKVTTSCDVYSLGAILFFLLAGRRSGATDSAAIALERAVNEREPDRLTQAITPEAAAARGVSETKLQQLLRGDLSTITTKCLRPRPRDRYASVSAVADDLHRYLDGLPVSARPQTLGYRVGKFVRRHRWAVAASVSIALVLLFALGYADWRQQQALQEGQRAVRMQSFLYRLFRLANSNHTGKPAATIPDFLRLGIRVLPDYIKDPADQRQAQLSLAESMAENDELDEALGVFAQVAASAEAAGDVQAQAEAEAHGGDISYRRGRVAEGAKLTAHALQLARKPGVSPAVRIWSEIYYAVNRDNNGFRSAENLRLLQQAAQEARDYHLPPHETADAISIWATDLELRGDLRAGEQAFREALQVYEQDPGALCDRSEVYGDLGYSEQMEGKVAESLAMFQKSYDGYVECSGADSLGSITAEEYVASTLDKLGRPQEALPILQALMPQFRKLMGNVPDLSEPLNFLIIAELDTGHFTDAEQHAREMAAVQEGKVAPTDRRFGATHLLWARALIGQHREAEALPHARIAAQLLNQNAVSVGGKQAGAEARDILLQVQSKLSAR